MIVVAGLRGQRTPGPSCGCVFDDDARDGVPAAPELVSGSACLACAAADDLPVARRGLPHDADRADLEVLIELPSYLGRRPSSYATPPRTGGSPCRPSPGSGR